MWRNILKQVYLRNSIGGLGQMNTILNTSATTSRLRSHVAASDEKRAAAVQSNDIDIDAALDIGASLFENSEDSHSPVMAKEVLRQAVQRRQTSKKTHKNKAASFTSQSPNKQLFLSQERKIVHDTELGLRFARLSKVNDPILTSIMTAVHTRKQRDKHRQIIVEGRRLIREALECGLHLETLLFSQIEQLKQLNDELPLAQHTADGQAKVYKVAQHDLKVWSTLTTPPGLLAVFKRPPERGLTITRGAVDPLPITVVCDNVREPNNLGSIIRSCAAIPCEQVVITRGCCDPWESKALRGGCGGQFRVRLLCNIDWDALPLLIPAEVADDCRVFIADNKMGVNGYNSVDYSEIGCTGAHNILIVGGESHGISENAYNFLQKVGCNSGRFLHIPLANGVESLNVASATTLILYELRKRLRPT